MKIVHINFALSEQSTYLCIHKLQLYKSKAKTNDKYNVKYPFFKINKYEQAKFFTSN